MKRILSSWLSFGALIFVILALNSCGKVWDPRSAVVTEISPEYGSVSVPIDSAVTAAFSDSIEEPENWLDSFMLKKDGEGENLCTEIIYDSDELTATCVHEELLSNSIYAVSVLNLRDSAMRMMYDEESVFYTEIAE